MEICEKVNFRLVGLKLETKTTNENNQSNVDCGNLWQKFESDKIAEQIPYKLSNEIFAVYYDYEGDKTKAFSYFIGCKVDENAEIPKGLNELIIPAQQYAKVIAKGEMTGCITQAWEKIWNSNLNRQFGFDFEIYDERSQNWNNAEVTIFVSINS